MRKLTKPEIDAAPGWATHYTFEGGVLIYENKTTCTTKTGEVVPNCWFGKGQPIPCKDFDIKSYEFDDPILSVSEFSKESIAFNCYTRESVTFTREDWIAGAKHFKLTSSDLS